MGIQLRYKISDGLLDLPKKKELLPNNRFLTSVFMSFFYSNFYVLYLLSSFLCHISQDRIRCIEFELEQGQTPKSFPVAVPV